MKYTLSKIADIAGGTLHGEDRQVCHIATDSRNHVDEDSLFVALRGASHNGHDYIDQMLDRGVLCFMTDTMPQSRDGSYVVVNNTLAALQALAAYHRLQYQGEVIAITGSNGKTIVKEWFAQLWLNENGKLLRSPRSYNSQLGVALSLLMIEGDERLVFIEAGISEVGEMERLQQMISPTIGVLTNIGDSHLHNFTSKEQLRAEKMKLFEGVSDIIFADETLIDIDERNKDLVLKIYRKVGLNHKPVSEIQPIAMRLELKEGLHGSTIINDSYINDLASLGIALDYQNRLNNPRKVLIFSDFHGSYEAVANLVKQHNIELFIGIGKEILRYTKLFPQNSLFYKNTEEFIRYFDTKKISKCSILLKGSRSFSFERISYALENRTHTTILEIDLDAMAANLNYYRSLLHKGCRTMAMVKAKSYGSGSVEVASMLQHHGVDYLAVAFADEGVELRRGGIYIPIVVLNSDPHSFQVMIDHNLEPEIYSLPSLKDFINIANRCGVSHYPIHIKLDTGMHRLGFEESDINELNIIISSQNTVKIASVFSHLAAADDSHEDDFTLKQIEKFKAMAERLPKALWHICNTSGIERFADAHFDMVRLGIGLYTGREVVSRLKTQIVQVKTISSGETIGYGRHGKPISSTRIATIPIGYADGLNRRLSRGVGSVWISGKLCPIIGNICMDTCMIDITNAPNAKEGDEVVIFGDKPTVEDLAKWLDTIPYEVLTSVSSRIKRVYVNG